MQLIKYLMNGMKVFNEIGKTKMIWNLFNLLNVYDLVAVCPRNVSRLKSTMLLYSVAMPSFPILVTGSLTHITTE